MPWWIMAAHRAEGAPGRIGVVGTLITVVGTPSELVRSIARTLKLVRSITPRMFCSTDTTTQLRSQLADDVVSSCSCSC